MGIHVEWVDAGSVTVDLVNEGFQDAHGQRVAEGMLGVALSTDDVVVLEGTRAELLAVAERIRRAVT